jgi:hypothetical protein
MRPLSVFAAILLAVSSLFAADHVSLTVYNQNIGMVRETRTIELNRGAGEMTFDSIAEQIVPSSVQIVVDSVDILEQNFDYDLISPIRVRDKYLGHEIEISNKNGEPERGLLLSSRTEDYMIQLSDGSICTYDDQQVGSVRYPSLPQGLHMRPSLRWKIKSSVAGQRKVDFSYLTYGLSWNASYVLLLDSMLNAELTSAVNLSNRCGLEFKNADLQLVAGKVNLTRDNSDYSREMRYMSSGLSSSDVREESLFEYHLYTLNRATTISNLQDKQLTLYDPAILKTNRIYEYDSRANGGRVAVFTTFDNSTANGIGKPLPGGTVRVYQRSSDGRQQFLGEDKIPHTPVNEMARVKVGDAFDVVAERREVANRSVTNGKRESDIEVVLRNHKPEPIDILVKEDMQGAVEIVRSSSEWSNYKTAKIAFRVTVKPEQETTLTYTIRTR